MLSRCLLNWTFQPGYPRGIECVPITLKQAAGSEPLEAEVAEVPLSLIQPHFRVCVT